MGVGFSFLLIDNFWQVLIIHMIFVTIAEMISFPFTNSFAMQSAKKGYEGSYMGWYAISFSFAHILCPFLSFKIIANYGYQTNWMITILYALGAMALSLWLKKLMEEPKYVENKVIEPVN